MLKQEEFDTFVENYNADYLYLLTRASRGDYDCLISSFTVLKDLYEVILKLQDTLGLAFRVAPHPLSFGASDELLSGFGFGADAIAKIHEFLGFVRQTQGRDFEQVIKDGVPVKCAKMGGV